MKKVTFAIIAAALPLAGYAEPFQQAEVTKTINSVTLLRENRDPKPAASGDTVNGDTAVKTGGDSRVELVFPDKTVTRIGANALFRFREGGRAMTLDGGTMLFSSPKGVGGGQVQAGAVTAAVTGTSFIMYYLVGGAIKLVVLEGTVVVYLTADPSVRLTLGAGEAATLPAGSLKFEKSVLDLMQILTTSMLLEAGGLGDPPEKALLYSAAKAQQGNITELPASELKNLQAAQITRNLNQAGGPPQPIFTPPPKPASTPFVPLPQAKPSSSPRPPPPPPPPPVESS